MKSRLRKNVVTITLLTGIFFGGVHHVFALSTDDFILTVKTDMAGVSALDQFTIPTHPSETYNYNVDCNGDEINEAIGVTGDYTCDYSTLGLGGPGTYTIHIKDNTGDGSGFPRMYARFNTTSDNKKKILSIDQRGTGHRTSMSYFCYDCSNLVLKANDVPNLSNVTDLSYMFYNNASFTSTPAINNWNVSNVTNMESMFDCEDSTLTTSPFNTYIGDWDVSNVTNMAWMFASLNTYNQDLSKWDTSNVTNMSYMFHNSPVFNQNISNRDTSKVTNMSRMFHLATSFNQPLSNWNTSNANDMAAMFWGASSFNQDISNRNTSNVVNMGSMFRGASSFNQDISNRNTSNVVNMGRMFHGATVFNQNLGGWDITKIGDPTSTLLYKDMNNMFDNSNLSVANYDATLIGRATQIPLTASNLGSVGLEYCRAETQRNSLITDGLSITGDTKSVVPCPPLTSPDLTTDTGISNTDNLTNDATPDFILACNTSGSLVTLYIDGVVSGTGTCIPGSTSITSTITLTGGTHLITYTESNEEGESDQSPTLTVTIDTSSPIISIVQVDTDTTVPYQTLDTTPTLVMNTQPGDMVVISGYVCTPSPATSTSVSCTPSNSYSAPSTQTVSISITDQAGNTGTGTVDISIVTSGGGSSSVGGGGGSTTYSASTTGTTTSGSAPTDVTESTTGVVQDETPAQAYIYTHDEVYNDTIQDGICFERAKDITIFGSKTITVSDEFLHSLHFLYAYGLTKFNHVDDFDPYRSLSRQEAAKIFSNFAINVLCRKPDISLQISYTDIAQVDASLEPYIILAYQLGLMKGSDQGGGQFRPFDTISKAEFNAVLIRMILKSYLTEENTEERYTAYNKVATDLGIITQGADETSVIRNDASLMLFRAYKEQVFSLQVIDYASYVLENRALFVK